MEVFGGQCIPKTKQNIGIDTKIIKFELIVTDLWPFRGFGGHPGRHIDFTCDVMANIIFLGLNAFLSPKYRDRHQVHHI